MKRYPPWRMTWIEMARWHRAGMNCGQPGCPICRYRPVDPVAEALRALLREQEMSQ